nr:unnamed protein product [Digitaria exilis]
MRRNIPCPAILFVPGTRVTLPLGSSTKRSSGRSLNGSAETAPQVWTFFVPSMSGRRDIWPLRGLQTKRVMSGSMSRRTPSPSRAARSLATTGAVAGPSSNWRRRRPSPLVERTAPPRRPRLLGSESMRGKGLMWWAGTRRSEKRGGSASWRNARGDVDLTRIVLSMIAQGGRDGAVERLRRRPAEDTAAEMARRSRSGILGEARRRGTGEVGGGVGEVRVLGGLETLERVNWWWSRRKTGGDEGGACVRRSRSRSSGTSGHGLVSLGARCL